MNNMLQNNKYSVNSSTVLSYLCNTVLPIGRGGQLKLTVFTEVLSPMSRPGSGQLKVDAAAMAWPCR